jgi:uncharacterized membrane protein required for colicin V production
MIMIGADMPNLALNNLPVNWFDGVVVGMLIIGLFVGRKRGMSKEFLPLFKWVSLVVVCGFFHPMAAQLLVNTAQLGSVSSNIFGYLLLAAVIFIVFSIINWLVASRRTENNIFGGSEYYLGMLSGMIRFVCMVLPVVALLNAPYYTAAEIKKHDAYVKRWFGGGLYSGNYFPSVHTVQEQVFTKSFLGPYVKDYLGRLLIEVAPPPAATPEKKPAVINIVAPPPAATPEKKPAVVNVAAPPPAAAPAPNPAAVNTKK